MSELPTDYRDRLYLREQRALMAEADKLAAEERKLVGDRGLAPGQATAITVTSIAALIASAITLAKSLGWL